MFLTTYDERITTMFGPVIRLKSQTTDLQITLRPLWVKEEARLYARGMSKYSTLRYLGRSSGATEADEDEWFDKVRKDKDSVQWAITVDESIIGMTGLSGFDPICNHCTSGILIIDQNWWGKGVATLAHLGRTWYAARQRNVDRIWSHVRTPNPGSWKALERVGYFTTYEQPWSAFVEGKYISTFELLWINPEKNIDLADQLKGEMLQKAQAAHIRAKIALELADRSIVK